MAESDNAIPKQNRDVERRLADKVWDVGLKIISALLGLMMTVTWVKLDASEKRITALEVRNASLEAQGNGTAQTLKDIKEDIRDIKNDLKVRRNP